MKDKNISFILATLLVSSFTLLVIYFINLENNKNNNNSYNDKIKVASTIFPLYDIVEEIGGDKVEVELIIPSGASPHTFEATPKLIKDLQGTRTFFVIGHGVDDWIADVSTSVSGADVYLVDKDISLISFEEDNAGEYEDHEYEENINPHYWLSTNNAKIIARNVASKLIELDPENKEYYESRANNFSLEIESNEENWSECMKSLENRNLVVFHDAWGYFTKQFELNIVASFEPYPGKTPSPQYLADLENLIKDSGVKVLYVEPQFSEEAVKTLAQDLGVEIKVLDPLGGVEGRDSYIKLMDFNVNQICS